MQPSKYNFTADWFTSKIKNFERFLTPSKDQEVKFLEIGSYEGRSAAWLLDNILTHPNAELYCVDSRVRAEFFNNIAKAGTSFNEHTGLARGVVFYHSDSLKCLRQLPLDFFDFIYVDGSHGDASVLQDAVLSFSLLKNGGILAFDDYLWDDPQFNQYGVPRGAIDAFLNVFKHSIEILLMDYQVWLRKTQDRRSTPPTKGS